MSFDFDAEPRFEPGTSSYHALLHLDVRMQLLAVEADDDDALDALFRMGALLMDQVDPGHQDVHVGVVLALRRNEL